MERLIIGSELSKNNAWNMEDECTVISQKKVQEEAVTAGYRRIKGNDKVFEEQAGRQNFP